MMTFWEKRNYLRNFIREWGYTRTIEWLLASEHEEAEMWTRMVEIMKYEDHYYWSESKEVEHKWQGWKALV